MTMTIQDGAEEALQAFLAAQQDPAAVRLRTLAHAWTGGGGSLQVGRHAVRLIGRDAAGRDFTAGTLHAAPPRLELARVLLGTHGVAADAWLHWSDELVDLRRHGFDAGAKFPSVALDTVTDVEIARLAIGLRDLARLVRGVGGA